MKLRRSRVVLTVLLLLSACAREERPSEALPFEPGALASASAPSETYEDPDFHAEVLGTAVCDPGPPFLPPPNHRRLEVTLRVTSRSKRPVPVSPLAFQLEDERGHRFGATLSGCGDPIPSVRLDADRSVEGRVAFDVPKDSGPLRLVYEPFLIGRAKVSAVLIVPPPRD